MKIIKQLNELHRQSAKELDALQEAIRVLRGHKRHGRKLKVRKNKMSASARKRISVAQKARWAKWYKKNKVVAMRRIA